jgi:hypothetical protein
MLQKINFTSFGYWRTNDIVFSHVMDEIRAVGKRYVFAESVIANTAAFKAGARPGHAVTTLAKSASRKACESICESAFASASCSSFFS